MITGYKVITSGNPKTVEREVEKLMGESRGEGDPAWWEPSGPLTCQTRHSQNRFSGLQHMDTVHQLEYCQAMFRVERA